MTAELVIRWSGGELDLMGWNDGEHGDFLIETLADGTDWGNPEPVRRALRRFLADGSSSVKEYDDNRTIPLSLRVTAADGTALAGGEQALDLIDGRRCELVWTPPDLFSVPALFVVDFADLRHKMDDLAETRRPPRRFYTLSLECLPHAYSVDYVEAPAVPQVVSTRTEFDDCATTTGWSSSGVTISDAGDYIQVTYPAGVSGGTVTRTGVVDFTTDRYLAVVHSGLPKSVTRFEAEIAGAWTTVPQAGTEEWATFLYDVNASVTALRWTFTAPAYNEIAVLFDNPAGRFKALGKQATKKSAATQGEIRLVEVPGSRRASASVEMVTATGNLQQAIVYSGPSYDPSLSSRLAEGNIAQVGTGGYADPATETTLYRWPAEEIPPGRYVAWAELYTAGTGFLEFVAELYTSAGLARSVSLDTIALPDVFGTLTPLFSADLPGWDLPAGTTAEFGLRINLSGDSASAQFPWLWLFNVSDGALFAVKAGTDSKMWILPPSLERDHPVVLTGETTLAEALPRSLDSEVLSWGSAFSLTPPLSTLYSWSSSATDVEVDTRFRPAHHTHPTS